ncbi:MAG TPA: hypothetical protein VGE63_02660 [Candidatus Paceibacterota bacterium]
MNVTLSENFVAKTDEFEGPLDALLDLLDKKKLSVSTISLSSLVDDFSRYISEVEGISHDEVVSLIYVLSVLVVAKSSYLLGSSSEEEQEVVLMTQKLEILARMRSTILQIQKMAKAYRVWLPQRAQIIEAHFRSDPSLKPSLMRTLVQNILQGEVKKEREEVVHKKVIVRKVVPIHEIKNIVQRVTNSLFDSQKRIPLSGVFTKLHETLLHPEDYTPAVRRKHVAISFVSILEEVRHGDLDLEIDGDEFVIIKKDPDLLQ